MPCYLQIADHLRTLILKGYFSGGDRLSERFIARQTGVSRNTVTRAFNILREYGFLDSNQRFSTRITRGAARLTETGVDWQRLLSRSIYKEKSSYFKQQINNNITDSENSVVTLRFNNKEFGTADFFYDVVHSLTRNDVREKFNVLSAQGLPALREEVAMFLRRYGVKTAAENIVIFSWTGDALACVSSIMIPPNTVVFNQEHEATEIFSPFPQTNYRCQIRSDGEGMIPSELKRLLNANAGRNRVLLISPINHVPTGAVMSARRIEEIAALCRKEQVPIIEIDMLRDITVVPPPFPFVTHSPSSVINIGAPGIASETGITFGWIIVPDSLVYKFVNAKSFMYGANNTREILAWHMFKDGRYEKYLNRVQAVCAGRNNAVNAALEKYLGQNAAWDKNAAVFKTVKLKNGLILDKRVIDKYLSLTLTKLYNAPDDTIFMEIITMSKDSLVNMVIDLAKNYITTL